MKIAYLSSYYPAVSQTFISREVRALRDRGVEIATFSVRRTPAIEVVGPENEAEAKVTPWLAPTSIRELRGVAFQALRRE